MLVPRLAGYENGSGSRTHDRTDQRCADASEIVAKCGDVVSREQSTNQYLELWRNKKSLDDKNSYYGKPKWNWEEQQRRADVWFKQEKCQMEAARKIRIQTNMAYLSANHTTGAEPPRAATPAKTASNRSEAEAVLSKVLRAAKLDNAMLEASPERFEELRDMDAVWFAGRILGWLRVVKAKNADQAAEWVTEGEARGCKKQSGQSSKKTTQVVATMTRVSTFCTLTDGTQDENYFIIVPRSSGGYYVFATLPTNPSTFEEARHADEKIASVVSIISASAKPLSEAP